MNVVVVSCRSPRGTLASGLNVFEIAVVDPQDFFMLYCLHEAFGLGVVIAEASARTASSKGPLEEKSGVVR
jgi:hypothetical protein